MPASARAWNSPIPPRWTPPAWPPGSLACRPRPIAATSMPAWSPAASPRQPRLPEAFQDVLEVVRRGIPFPQLLPGGEAGLQGEDPRQRRRRLRVPHLPERRGREQLRPIEMRQPGALELGEGLGIAPLAVVQPGEAEEVPAGVQRVQPLRAAGQ